MNSQFQETHKTSAIHQFSEERSGLNFIITDQPKRNLKSIQELCSHIPPAKWQWQMKFAEIDVYKFSHSSRKVKAGSVSADD